MAAHSCGVLKEHFEKTRSLHRHDAEQRVWAVSNKLLQGKGLCIYKDIACKKASAYQNGLEYTADNMDALILRRYENKKLLRAGKHPKGSPKRTKEQDVRFADTLEKILSKKY